MSITSVTGQFTASSSLSQSIDTGLGAPISALILFGVDETTNGVNDFSISSSRGAQGFSDGTSHGCAGAALASVGGNECSWAVNDKIYALYDEVGVLIFDATVVFGTASEAGEFTLTYDSVNGGGERLVNYLAIAGLDNAEVSSRVIGTNSSEIFTLSGSFQPDVVLTMGAADNATHGVWTTETSVFYGVALNSTDRHVITARLNSSEATSWLQQDCCILASNTNGTIKQQFDFSSSDATGFSLDRIGAASISLPCLFLSLAHSSGEFERGVFTQPSTTGNQNISASFIGSSVLFHSADKTSGSQNDQSTEISIGAMDSGSNQHSIYWGYESSAGSGRVEAIQNAYTILSYNANDPTTLEAGAESVATPFTSSDSSSQFTVNWTTADATAREQAYLLIGAAEAAEAVSLWSVNINCPVKINNSNIKFFVE